LAQTDTNISWSCRIVHVRAPADAAQGWVKVLFAIAVTLYKVTTHSHAGSYVVCCMHAQKEFSVDDRRSLNSTEWVFLMRNRDSARKLMESLKRSDVLVAAQVNRFACMICLFEVLMMMFGFLLG
jgi:hypothetical protein